MRVVVCVAAVIVLMATPSYAQQTERGYVEGAAGFATSPDTTSGDVLGQVGVRIAPHLLVFGDFGQFRNLQPSTIQPSVDLATATLAADQGVTVVGTGRVPASYAIGGLRFEIPTNSRVTPYVLGGVGFARLTPTAQFTYSSGTLAGVTPTAGNDVTDQVVSMGDFTQPAATTAFTFSLGGGVAIPVAHHWTADVGYRFSRVSADTPLNAQGMTFGVGYRF